ncbi:NmrA family protein [candidate division KSB1 bacterium RBG_16_48_16]|nr:MAG: NmrA family protein [candidate division KSB1 bacterium RBG_16_48_16]
MADTKTILVTGATGQQGGAVAHELLAKGYHIRAMTRKPEGEKALALARLGAEVIKGDLDDTASLEQAIKGAWGVFAVQNTWEAGVEKEEEQGKRIAPIAKKLGVQHYVYTSVGSAHRKTGIPHFDNKWRVEETVRQLGFPSYTIIRAAFFMENLASPWFKPGIDQGKLMIGMKPETTLQMIAVQDVGKYGLWAFEQHRKLNGRAIDIAGDALTMPEAAKLISKAAGKKVEFVQVPIEEVRKASEDFAIMLEWFDRVGYNADIDATSKESGIAPTTFEQWVTTVDWS